MGYLRTRPELLAWFRDGEEAAKIEVYRAYIGRIDAWLRRGFPGGSGTRVPGLTNSIVGQLALEGADLGLRGRPVVVGGETVCASGFDTRTSGPRIWSGLGGSCAAFMKPTRSTVVARRRAGEDRSAPRRDRTGSR